MFWHSSSIIAGGQLLRRTVPLDEGMGIEELAYFPEERERSDAAEDDGERAHDLCPPGGQVGDAGTQRLRWDGGQLRAVHDLAERTG